MKKGYFVSTGGLPDGAYQNMSTVPKPTPSLWTEDSFRRALTERNVCPIAVVSNHAQWFREVMEAEVTVETYLRYVDCRRRGALLHQDALALAVLEKQAIEAHPWSV